MDQSFDWSAAKPPVLTWFKVYAGVMTFLSLTCIAMGMGLLFVDVAALGGDFDPLEVEIQGGAMLVLGLPLTILFPIALFLPNRPWVWIYDLVLICVGLTSCCLWPASIPLLIFWIKVQTRQWFGMDLD